jgi:hypothetical protein
MQDRASAGSVLFNRAACPAISSLESKRIPAAGVPHREFPNYEVFDGAARFLVRKVIAIRVNRFSRSTISIT